MLEQIIRPLNQVFPETLPVDTLSQPIETTDQAMEEILHKLIEEKWPLYLEGGQVGLKFPLFTANDIIKYLPNRLKNKFHITIKESVESTNDLALNYLSDLKDWTVILAYQQTKGKTRKGNDWQSPLGESISMSILKKGISPNKVPIASSLTALALVRALAKLGIKGKIKWPNDVLVNGKKIAGILNHLEVSETGQASIIFGIGINVNQTSLPDDLASKASSLRLEAGKIVDPNQVIAYFLEALDQLLTSKQDEATIMEDVSRHTLLINDIVDLHHDDGLVEPVKVLGLADNGALIVRNLDSHKDRYIYSGQVSVRKPGRDYI